MRIGKLGSLLAALVIMGVPAHAAAEPVFIDCSGQCLLPGRVAHAFSSSGNIVRGTILLRNQDTSRMDVFGNERLRSFGWPLGFSYEVLRQVDRKRAVDERFGVKQTGKVSAGISTVRYGLPLGEESVLSFGAGAGLEKRRFTTEILRRHARRGETMNVAADWTYESSLRLTAGYRVDTTSSGRGTLMRGIELASGAPRSQSGAWTAISFTPTSPDATSSLTAGLRLQSMRLTQRDRVAMGAQMERDNRLAATASLTFR